MNAHGEFCAPAPRAAPMLTGGRPAQVAGTSAIDGDSNPDPPPSPQALLRIV
jgi:hypothetical protein